MPLHVLFCSSVIPYEKEKFASSYLLITVKDNSLVGGGVFLGEALLPLSEVKESSIDQNLAELPQIQLPLTKPSRDQGRPNLLLRGKEIRLLCFLQFEPARGESENVWYRVRKIDRNEELLATSNMRLP